jgi:RNA polymerase sigma-70 factor (ECF subfamily)
MNDSVGPDCHVIVRPSTELPAATTSQRVDVDATAARAEVFRRLADRHLDRAYGLARVILGNHAEAEDATHDAFVIAWRKSSSLRDPERFEPWFDRIVINTCRNRLKSNRRHEATDLSPDMGGLAADAYGQIDDRQALGAAFARLSPDHRVVVALRYYRDLTVEDIAIRLDIRPGTVKSRLHYALRQLQVDLNQTDAKESHR